MVLVAGQQLVCVLAAGWLVVVAGKNGWIMHDQTCKLPTGFWLLRWVSCLSECS